MKRHLILFTLLYIPYNLFGLFSYSQHDTHHKNALGASAITSLAEFAPDSIINLFAAFLNSYINNDPIGYFKGIHGKCYGGFEIIDLSDTSNNSFHNLIKFEVNHVYVFGSTRKSIQYSNIALVQKDTIYFYKAINCPDIETDASGIINTIQNNEFEIRNKDYVINLIYYYTQHSLYDYEMDPHEQIYGGVYQCETLLGVPKLDQNKQLEQHTHTEALARNSDCYNDTIMVDVMLIDQITGFPNCGGFTLASALEFEVIKSSDICLEVGDSIQIIIFCPNETFASNTLCKGKLYSVKLINALKYPNSELKVYKLINVI